METAPAETNIRRRLRSMLSGLADQRIADVGNGVERVLDSVRRLHPSILIVDIQTKGGQGIDLLRRVQTDHPDTDIIVLTNKADRFYRRACLNAGARFFLDKSIEIERVKDAVAKLRSKQQST